MFIAYFPWKKDDAFPRETKFWSKTYASKQAILDAVINDDDIDALPSTVIELNDTTLKFKDEFTFEFVEV